MDILYGTLIFMLAINLPSIAQGFSFKIIPIDSVESPFFPKNVSLERRHQIISELSKARALYLQSLSFNLTMETTWLGSDAIQPIINRALSNFYLIKTTVGSQSYSSFLMFDSGADNTWMQCQGCTRCLQFKGTNFNSTASKSYRPLSCGHTLCVPKKCNAKKICIYNVQYFGGHSIGLVGSETFSFSTTTGSSQSFSGLAFGCGYDNAMSFGKNELGGNNIAISGVFGLGTGKRSFLTQLGQQTRGRFSYCLPSWTSKNGTYAILRFGDDAQIKGDAQRKVQTTSLEPRVPTYHLRLSGISVDGTLLNIGRSMFKLKPNWTGGFVIDTGAGHTVLVQRAYQALRAAMVRYFQLYNLKPSTGVQNQYDLCYKKPATNVTLPSMTFHFEGADLRLDSNAVFEQFGNGFCMMIMEIKEPGPSILGAFQQANHRFSYDTRALTLSFVPEICLNN